MSPLPTPEDADKYVGVLERFLNVFRKHLGTILIILLLGVVLGSGWQFKDQLWTRSFPDAPTEATRVYQGAVKDQAMDAAVAMYRDKLMCDRLVVYDMHNNVHGLSGVPWSKASARYWSIKQGVGFDSQVAQNTSNTQWWEVILGTMPEEGGYKGFSSDTFALKSGMLKEYAVRAGTEHIFAYGVRDPHAQDIPVSFILCTFINNAAVRPDDQVIFAGLAELSSKYQEWYALK